MKLFSVMCCGFLRSHTYHTQKNNNNNTFFNKQQQNIRPLNSINYFLCLCLCLCSRLPKIFHKKLTNSLLYTMYNTHTLIEHSHYIIYMHYPQQECNIKELYRHIKMICMKINCVQFIFIVHHLTSSFIFIFSLCHLSSIS